MFSGNKTLFYVDDQTCKVFFFLVLCSSNNYLWREYWKLTKLGLLFACENWCCPLCQTSGWIERKQTWLGKCVQGGFGNTRQCVMFVLTKLTRFSRRTRHSWQNSLFLHVITRMAGEFAPRQYATCPLEKKLGLGVCFLRVPVVCAVRPCIHVLRSAVHDFPANCLDGLAPNSSHVVGKHFWHDGSRDATLSPYFIYEYMGIESTASNWGKNVWVRVAISWRNREDPVIPPVALDISVKSISVWIRRISLDHAYWTA
jgi:hypothetical protein